MESKLDAPKAVKILGVTVKTLQRWERECKLIPVGRTGSNRRRGYVLSHGCQVMVLNQKRLSPEVEMVKDLMTIVHCFSSRLYGLRNYRRKLNEALEQDHAAGAPHPA